MFPVTHTNVIPLCIFHLTFFFLFFRDACTVCCDLFDFTDVRVLGDVKKVQNALWTSLHAPVLGQNIFVSVLLSSTVSVVMAWCAFSADTINKFRHGSVGESFWNAIIRKTGKETEEKYAHRFLAVYWEIWIEWIWSRRFQCQTVVIELLHFIYLSCMYFSVRARWTASCLSCFTK